MNVSCTRNIHFQGYGPLGLGTHFDEQWIRKSNEFWRAFSWILIASRVPPAQVVSVRVPSWSLLNWPCWCLPSLITFQVLTLLLSVMTFQILTSLSTGPILMRWYFTWFFELGIYHQRQSKRAPCWFNWWFLKDRSQIRTKMIANQFAVSSKYDPNLVQFRSKFGPKLVKIWSKIGPKWVQNRSKIVQMGSLKPSWNIRGPSWGPRWPHGRFLDDFGVPLGVTFGVIF